MFKIAAVLAVRVVLLAVRIVLRVATGVFVLLGEVAGTVAGLVRGDGDPDDWKPPKACDRVA